MKEADAATDNMSGFLAAFNRYGFPGIVTGAMFLLVAAILYWCANTMIPVLQATTKAVIEVTAALNKLTEEVRR